jgi:hypothetical protein
MQKLQSCLYSKTISSEIIYSNGDVTKAVTVVKDVTKNCHSSQENCLKIGQSLSWISILSRVQMIDLVNFLSHHN